MSLLTKIFIILVFMAALVALGVQATLFAHRIDWKDKFTKETNYHYQTIQIKDSEIEFQKQEAANRMDLVNAQRKKIDLLEQEKGIYLSRINELNVQITEAGAVRDKALGDVEALSAQLQVYGAHVKDKEIKINDLRDKLARAIERQHTSVAELSVIKADLEKVSKDLSELEERHVSVVREKRRQEDILDQLEREGFNVRVGPPMKAIQGKVMSVAGEAGMLIINQGKDHGVTIGMKFTIYRGDQFIANAIVKEAARDWSALAIQLTGPGQKPQTGDDASNHLLVSGSRK